MVSKSFLNPTTRATEEDIQRATDIVREFTTWALDTGPCPIGINDRHWFKKLCALAEYTAMLERRADGLGD